MDVRSYARIIYLSLALGLPISRDPSSTWYDDRLQAIESHLMMGNSQQTIEHPLDDPRIKHILNDINDRAALVYGYYAGRCPQFLRFPVDLPGPEHDRSTPQSPAERRALLREVERLTNGTRKCKHRLPEKMPPGSLTWEYIDAWRKALGSIKALRVCRRMAVHRDPTAISQPSLFSVPNQSAWDHSSNDGTNLDHSSESSESTESRGLHLVSDGTESEDPDEPPPYQ